MLTNRLGFPRAIANAVANDPYTKGESDISVTQLIAPPYQRKLRAENEVIEDVADRIWSLVGQVGHGIVERAYPEAYEDEGRMWVKVKAFFERLGLWDIVAEGLDKRGYTIPAALSALEAYRKHGVVAENRLFMKVNGWVVSGQFDVIEGGALSDYKFTSAWSVIDGGKAEWDGQLNILRLLAREAGIEVNRLGIIAVLRDWTKGKAFQPNYPKHQIAKIDVPMWSVAQAEDYLMQRVLAHQAASPPPCSDEERWKKPDVFAVMKAGRKSAVKLFDGFEEAEAVVKELGAGHKTVKRNGGYTRCEAYCNVSHVCPQMATEVGF